MKKKIRSVVYLLLFPLLFLFMAFGFEGGGYFAVLTKMDRVPESKPDPITPIYNKITGNGKPYIAVRSSFLFPTEKKTITSSGGIVELNGAKIEIPALSLKNPKEISITALGNESIPVLQAELLNVTASDDGYRFLPHGTHFEKPAKVFLSYDENKIPTGYTAADIMTYYFDELSAKWIPLEKAYTDERAGQVISLTNHFTDMINGIIIAPESPQTHNNTPTSIQNIKAADPSDQITTIAPPVASSLGNASLEFPLKLPAGRMGMEPELSVNYNSGGANGWLGTGWDLAIQSITIDTKWGVPRYDLVTETETYLMNNEQLSPVAHRGIQVGREAEKQFYPRVESNFQKIIRHGNDPRNYWWEVKEKNGTSNFYGGKPGHGPDDAFVLKTSEGNIAHWALAETRDMSGNFISYQYKKITDVGIPGGTVPGYQLYIEKITYTGHGSEEGKYSVIFKTNRDLDEQQRRDVIINGRSGFKQVTADLLRKIEIQFDGSNVRSYELKYHEGAFFKTLLDDIIEFDAGGQEFYKHHLDYYDNVRAQGIYHPLDAQQAWITPNDDVHGTFFNPIDHFGDKISTLGGNKSIGGGFGFTITAGLYDARLYSKEMTAGGSFGFSIADNEGLLQLIDINGDALPDKVFKKGQSLFYRPNRSGPDGQLRFGDSVLITGVSNFDQGNALTFEGGIESNFVVYAGLQFSQTTNKSSTYFADVNGDQLVDIVSQGTVYFNHLDAGGHPTFTAQSGDTPSPIYASAGMDPSLYSADSAELKKQEKDFPLHDIVKVWKAPYAGTISITGPLKLVEDTSPARQGYQTADGVKVSVQRRGTVLWSTQIAENDYSEKNPVGLNSIIVAAGDQIYFRVQSIYDGAYDQVNWVPLITYSNHSAAKKDANALPVYQFNASADFLPTAAMSLGMPFKGTVRIRALFNKPQTSDDIQYEIVKKDTLGNQQIIWQQQLRWDSVQTNFPVDFTNAVKKGDELFFRTLVSTNIGWTKITWSPRVNYISSDDPSVTQMFNNQGEPLYDFHPVVDYTIYNRTIHPPVPWVVGQGDTLTIKPKLLLAPFTFESGTITFSVKKENQLIAKEDITVNFGTITGDASLSYIANAGDNLFIEYHTRNEKLWNSLIVAAADIKADTLATIIPAAQIYSVGTGSRTNYNEGKYQFGAMYRNWGQFVYNGNGDLALQPIDESELVIASSLTNPQTIDLHVRDTLTAGDAPQMQSIYNNNNGNTPNKDRFIYMIPWAKEVAWKGYDELTYTTNTILSASRMGKDDLGLTNPLHASSGNSSGASGITKVTRTDNINLSAAFIVGVSYSHGTTNHLFDFMDMNGDQYPDILSTDKIQYTVPTGGLESSAKTFGFHEVEQSASDAFGVSLGGTFISSSSFNSKTKSKGAKAGRAAKSALAAGSLSGGFNYNIDKTFYAWLDINGDGLPDRIYENGDVELNLGYSFAGKETWGFNGFSEGNTLGYSAGLGINLFYHSIAAGISLSRSENNLNKTLRDVNGDGLPDYITDQPLSVPESTSPLMVAINTGNGFAAPVPWTGANSINKDISTGEAINASFCACIPIIPILPVAKICINPSIEVMQGVSKETISITDINGDDFPDLLESEKDNELNIKLSSIGVTNLLRSVTRPMGANFVINYERTGNTYAMPNSMWVMSSVKMFDGVTGNGTDSVLTSYEYSDGLYNRNEREFYGFRTVKTNEHDTGNGNIVYRSSVKTFANSHYYEKGLLLSEFLQDAAGKKFNEDLYKYEFRDIQNGSVLPNGFQNSDAGKAFPALVETRTLIYEGQPTASKSTSIRYNYDLLGNVIAYTDLGDTDPSDDYTTQIAYHSLPGKYLMDAVKSVTVSGGGNIFRKKEQDINVQTGDITEIRVFSEPGVASVTNMLYDVYGNIAVLTRPKNETGQRLSYTYEYDTEVNTYPTRVSDSYGYFSSSVYDLRFGIALSTTDINNQATVLSIDNAGRINTITAPLESATGAPFTIAYEYHPHAEVPWALTRHYDPEHPGNFIETALFVDGLRRPLQVKKDGSIFNSPDATDTEVMLVSGANRYDAFGRVIESYYPTTEAKGNPGVYNRVRDTVLPTKTSYDILDRELSVMLPDGSLSTNRFGFGNDRNGVVQLSMLVTDANGKRTEVFTDVRGRTSSNKNYFQPNDIWTSYKYNAANELVSVKDDQQNTITLEYDWQGRRTKLMHPDAGLTTFQYDQAGLLVKKITANLQGTGKAITYNYDRERLQQINYPDNPQNKVKYTYGAMNASFNRAGRIVVQEDASGAQEFFYDALGNVIKDIRSILVPSKGVVTYKTENVFDTWNRIQSIVYPDGEILDYDYNTGGMFSGMHGKKGTTTFYYVPQYGYDKFEEKVYQKYANGTESFYSYEPLRRRLKQMVVETSKDRKIMNMGYTYDNETNITAISNTADIPPASLMGGSSMNQFTYDDLYRLTKANGNFKGSNHEHRYELTMVYNSIGNILQKIQTHDRKANNSPKWNPQKETTYSNTYIYTPAKPHEPIKIGTESYTYDLNGNQKGWTASTSGQQRTITWDEENRMRSLADNGALSSYIYDAQGERVLRNHGGGSAVKVNGEAAGGNVGIGNYTIYVDPYTEVRSGSYTKHYYADGVRMVSKLESGNEIPALSITAGRSANAGINYTAKEEEAKQALLKLYGEADTALPLIETDKNSKPGGSKENTAAAVSESGQVFLYYMHPDHLGNTAYITDAGGEVFQHLEYFPFGETFVEEHSNTNRTPYLFNGKELDDKTGLYYYGGRYYNTKTSVWQSVDPPIFSWFLGNGPGGCTNDPSVLGIYNYVSQNPVNFYDPDGFGKKKRIPKPPDGAPAAEFAKYYRASRPKYRTGVVETVWNTAVEASADGIVRDPNESSIILKWDKKKKRKGQWDMGHRPGHEYSDLVEQLGNGTIDEDEFLTDYNNPDNYYPEDPLLNQGRKYQKPGSKGGPKVKPKAKKKAKASPTATAPAPVKKAKISSDD